VLHLIDDENIINASGDDQVIHMTNNDQVIHMRNDDARFDKKVSKLDIYILYVLKWFLYVFHTRFYIIEKKIKSKWIAETENRKCLQKWYWDNYFHEYIVLKCFRKKYIFSQVITNWFWVHLLINLKSWWERFRKTKYEIDKDFFEIYSTRI